MMYWFFKVLFPAKVYFHLKAGSIMRVLMHPLWMIPCKLTLDVVPSVANHGKVDYAVLNTFYTLGGLTQAHSSY